MDDTLEMVPAAPSLIPAPAQSQPMNPLMIWVRRIAICLLMVAAAVFAWREGVRLRHWMWDTTAPIRVTTDIDRDYHWGRLAAKEGYLNQYEKMQNETGEPADWLDHPPLRLAVLTLWGRWSLEHFPKVEKWSSDHSYALTSPLMRFDLVMEAMGLIAAFFVTRLWTIRGFVAAPSGPSEYLRTGLGKADSLRWFFRGCIPASFAVLLLWFNPAVILNGYGLPAWDLWLIPIFLLAVLLASYECWFTAGIIVGIGVMLNEHMLLAIPLFLLWNIILHGWPKWRWPVLPSSLIAGGVAVTLAVLDWFWVKEEFLPALVLFIGEAAIVVSLLLGWSLIWRPLRPLRFAGGLIIAIAVIVSPWMLSYIPVDKLEAARAVQATFGEPAKVPLDVFKIARTIDAPAVVWVCCVLAAAIGLPFVAWLTLEKPAAAGTEPIPRWRHVLASQWAWRTFAAFGAIALVMWPWLIKRNHGDWWIGTMATAAMIVAIQLISPRGIAFLAAASVGTALLLCMSLFHGSTAWYDCGFHFQTVHYKWMALGMTDNLPAVMVHDFDWPRFNLETTVFTIPAHFLFHYPAEAMNVSIGAALQGLFERTLIFCCLGAGMHARRKSSRMLIALTAPWLMLFCFAPQIDERYLVFAAGISCICAGSSVGLTLLGVFLSCAAFVMMLHNMLATAGRGGQLDHFSKGLAAQFPDWLGPHCGDRFLEAINGTNPDLGYAIVLCGLIFLYFSLAPQRKTP